MYREIHTTAIIEHALSPDIGRLLALYDENCGNAALPTADRFSLNHLFAYRDDLVQVDPNQNGELTYTHFGKRVAALSGIDLTGRKVNQIGGDVGAFFHRCYEQAAELQGPVYTIHRSVFSLQVNLWEKLILPFRRRDGQTAFLALNKPREYNDTLLSSILEASPEGMIALRPILDSKGQMLDATIGSANRRAAEITGWQVDRMRDASLSQIFPVAEIWERATRMLKTRVSESFEIHYHNGSTESWLRVTMAPLGDGWLLSLSDISDLKRVHLELQAKNAALEDQMKRLKAMETQMRLAANTDALTGLANRRAFRSLALSDIELARRAGEPCSIVVFDIDHFKSINDAYGHAAGDAVLETVAWVMAVTCSDHTQTMARTGGEEFAMVLRGKTLEEAIAVSETLCRRIRDTETTFEALPIRTSASFGVAEIGVGVDLDDALRAADEALYRAKNCGRDRVVAAYPDEDVSPRPIRLRSA